MALLIKNGRLIDPVSGTDGIYDILIDNEKIKEVSSHIKVGSGIEMIDASGLVVSPGFIDVHVHLREPGQEHKEDIESGSRSAVRGGFTTIACMPNTTPVNDSVEVTRHIVRRAKEVGLLNIYPIAAVSRSLDSEVLTDMEELVAAGARGFTDDGRCVMSPAIFREALVKAKELRVPVMEHPEDHSISLDGQVNDGVISAHCKLKGIPARSEDVIIDRDILLQEEVGSYLHLTHISTGGAVKLIEAARKRKVRVTSDVTPHHLLIDEEIIGGCDPMYKMKPPLRTARDRELMVWGIREGLIDCIASDHAPHSVGEKNRSFEEAPFGVIGMETSFSVIYDRLVKSGIISIHRLIETFSTNPAKVLHLGDRGMVKPGVPGDLTIVDLERGFKISDQFESKSENCPFIGWEGNGTVEYTIVNGRIVYNRA
ncbi:MAG: dihydroorotase [bacterium]|nr:dihydroorotase [bacterium]